MSRFVVAGVAALIGHGSAATAQPNDPGRELDYVVVEPARPLWHAGPNLLYLNRCAAGCSADAGRDDAVADRSSILGRNGTPSSVSLAPFAWDDATWDGVVTCVRATYAIYGVEVVTEPPGGAHVEVMVAGTAAAPMRPSTGRRMSGPPAGCAGGAVGWPWCPTTPASPA